MQCLRAEKVLVLCLRELWLSKCLISLVLFLEYSSCCCKHYFPTTAAIISFCPVLGEACFGSVEVCGNDPEAYYSALIFSLKCTAGTSASIEKELHSLTQILQVRNHPDWNMDQRQSCQTGWVRLVPVVEGKRFIPPDGLDAGLQTLHCKLSHIDEVCVCEKEKICQIPHLHTCIHIE